MKDSSKCCDAAGAAQAKTGDNRASLSRPAGYAQACGAISNRTRSRHSASSQNNKYQSPPIGYGSNENIKGYG